MVFPNPVRPGYSGTVIVKNLTDNAVVRITDENGFLIWESKSKGGQVEWNTTDMYSKPVASGLYLIQASDSGGTVSALQKIVVLR